VLGTSIGAALRDLQPSGFASIVEASGSASALATAIEVVAQTGYILVLGDYGKDCASFCWSTLLHKEIELIGSNAGAWDAAVRLAVDGCLPLARLITQRLPAQRFPEGIDLTRQGAGIVKVVMEW
jgi:threonine dehydrogenase-like Zn-dependent dehydrogenase